MRKEGLFFLFLFLSMSGLRGQSVLGYWKTIDDVTDKPKSILEIYEEEDGLSARVVEILVDGRENALCVKCKGTRKNKLIRGMNVFEDLKKLDEYTYGEGEILDPETGKEYRVKIWIDPEKPDRLKVRGYIAFFFRTQTWTRVSP
ncbi:DUF2147 domain-containing protein [Muriicola sp.]|uniref:DUF2147 domain-containing protein n=2 Tax=Muriicola sp. TaxID=2020856 RepID=UPI0035670EEC